MTDRDHLIRLLHALDGTEEELIAAIAAATDHLGSQPTSAIPGLEVSESTFGEWLQSGG